MIKKQVDVGILAGVATSGRAEQVEMLNPELPEFSLVLFQPGYDFGAFHPYSLT